METLLDWAEETLCFDCEDPDAEAKAARQTYLAQKWAQFYRALRRIAFRRKRWGIEGHWLRALKSRAKGLDHYLLK